LLGLRLPKSISSKLLASFLALSAITAILGLFGIREIDAVGRLGIETYDRPLMAINYARSADTTFEQLANSEPTSGRPSADETPEDSFLSDIDMVEDRASSAEAIADLHILRDQAHEWLRLRRDPAERDAADHLSQRVRGNFDQLLDQLQNDGLRNREQAVATIRFARDLSIGMTGAALLASFLMAILLGRRIVRPFKAAAQVANRIAAGEFETPIPAGSQDEAGALLASMGAMQKRIREMMERETARRRSAQGRLIEALESSTEAMVLLDPDRRIVIANSRVEDVLIPLGAVKVREGMNFVDAFDADHADWLTRLSAPGEVQLPTGTWLSVTREEAVDGGVFLIWSDITLRKSYERKLESAAYEDPLTGVWNRAYLLERLDRDAHQRGAVTGSAMLVANIDRFRQINNAHGSRIGDGVLVAVAGRLKGLIEGHEICARTGGDEFVIWLPDAEGDRSARLADAIMTALSAPVATGDRVLTVHLSVGLALAASEGETGHDLVRDARAALDGAKQAGGNRVELFSDALRQENKIRAQIEADLPDAIRQRLLHLEFQPLIDLETGRVGGLEALARWRHPELGSIAPGRFIPIAEETGAIVELGRFVLDEAIIQTDRWFAEGLLDEDATIAVNLSPRQIADPRSAQELLDFLDRHAGVARRLKFEVTEGVLLQDPAAMAELLREFKKRGVGLSLDDFGTGYSSLSYLHKFPFDVLKIDRSFVMDVPGNADALRLVRAIIELGQDLGLALVAEGVETAAQADCLKSLGCDFAQGYYYSRPIDADKLTLFLREQQRGAPARRAAGTR